MKRLVEFPLEGGGVALVEVDDAAPGKGPGLVSRNDGVAEEAAMTFEKALGRIRPVANALLAQLSSLEAAPETVQVEFGIKLTGKAGAFICESSIEGHCKVTLGWQRQKTG
jgi:hypothetical protein